MPVGTRARGHSPVLAALLHCSTGWEGKAIPEAGALSGVQAAAICHGAGEVVSPTAAPCQPHSRSVPAPHHFHSDPITSPISALQQSYATPVPAPQWFQISPTEGPCQPHTSPISSQSHARLISAPHQPYASSTPAPSQPYSCPTLSPSQPHASPCPLTVQHRSRGAEAALQAGQGTAVLGGLPAEATTGWGARGATWAVLLPPIALQGCRWGKSDPTDPTSSSLGGPDPQIRSQTSLPHSHPVLHHAHSAMAGVLTPNHQTPTKPNPQPSPWESQPDPQLAPPSGLCPQLPPVPVTHDTGPGCATGRGHRAGHTPGHRWRWPCTGTHSPLPSRSCRQGPGLMGWGSQDSPTLGSWCSHQHLHSPTGVEKAPVVEALARDSVVARHKKLLLKDGTAPASPRCPVRVLLGDKWHR